MLGLLNLFYHHILANSNFGQLKSKGTVKYYIIMFRGEVVMMLIMGEVGRKRGAKQKFLKGVVASYQAALS